LTTKKTKITKTSTTESAKKRERPTVANGKTRRRDDRITSATALNVEIGNAANTGDANTITTKTNRRKNGKTRGVRVRNGGVNKNGKAIIFSV
jgi:hypothetical protein